MILLLKKKLISQRGQYDIFDQAGNIVYSATHKSGVGIQYSVKDANKNEVAVLKQKVFAFKPTFNICIGGEVVGTLAKKVSPLHPTYIADFKGWTMKGNFVQWNYNIFDDKGNTVAVIKWAPMQLTEAWTIDIAYDTDVLYAVLLVLAVSIVDAEKEQANEDG